VDDAELDRELWAIAGKVQSEREGLVDLCQRFDVPDPVRTAVALIAAVRRHNAWPASREGGAAVERETAKELRSWLRSPAGRAVVASVTRTIGPGARAQRARLAGAAMRAPAGRRRGPKAEVAFLLRVVDVLRLDPNGGLVTREAAAELVRYLVKHFEPAGCAGLLYVTLGTLARRLGRMGLSRFLAPYDEPDFTS
jgi:hypothetical protein